MATVQECLDGMVVAGKLSREDAEELMAAVRRRQRQHAQWSSASEAEIAAAVDALDDVIAAAARRERNAARQVLVAKTNDNRMAAHPHGKTAGAYSILVKDRFDLARGDNVYGLWRSWEGMGHGLFRDAMNWMRPKFAGLKHEKVRQDQFIDALYGADAGPEAKLFVQAWDEVAETMRLKLNALGADIAKKENWRLPQDWSAQKVGAVSERDFVAFFERELGDGVGYRLLDPETGEAAAGIEKSVRWHEIYEAVRTDGLNRLVPGQAGRPALANRLGQHRTIELLTADAWRKAMARFGSPDVYHVLTQHIREGARHIALLELLGPNPAAEARRLQDIARQGKALDGKEPGVWEEWIGRTYDVLSGAAGTPVSRAWANWAGGIRNVLATARLGRAMLTSITDEGFVRAHAALLGLDATRIMQRQLKLLNPLRDADRMTARRLAVVADHWLNEGMFAFRLMDDVSGWGRNMVDSFHKVTGLTPVTAARRDAFAMEFWAHLAELSEKTFAELPAEMRRFFDSRGFKAADWDTARTSPLLDIDGATFMAAENIARGGNIDVAARLNGMVQDILDRAVPTPDALDRTIATLGTRKGTPEGELVRSLFQFKTFSVTVTGNEMVPLGARLKDPTLSKAARAHFLAHLILTTTLMSALSIQLKELSFGKDPRDMEDPRFWGQAVLNSGGLAIYGDLFYSGFTRSDQSPVESLSGPMAGLVADVWKIVFGNSARAAREARTGRASRHSAIGEAINFVHRYTPGSSLFYLDLAATRLLWDQIQMAADPQWPRRFRDIERRAQRDWNQGHWWRPGSAVPERAPDWGAVRGGSK